MKHPPIRRFIVQAVVVYGLFASAWILLSDRLLVFFASAESIVQVSVIKGLLYVGVTTALFGAVLSHVAELVARDQQAGLTAPPPTPLRRWFGYGLAVILSALAVAVRLLLINDSDFSHHFIILLLVPILISALIGGFGPGLLATAIALAAAELSHPEAQPATAEHLAKDDIQLLLLGICGLLSSGIAGLLHKTRRRAWLDGLPAHNVLACMSDGVITVDEQDRIMQMNVAAENLTGWNQRAAKGHLLATKFITTAMSASKNSSGLVMPSNTHLRWLERSDGERLPISLSRSEVQLEGRRIGAVIVFRDESERLANKASLIASQQLLATIIDGSIDAIFAKDMAGRYLLCNRAAAAMVGKPVNDIVGRDDTELFPPAVAADLKRIDAAIIAGGETKTHEEHLQMPSGQNLIFKVTKGPIVNDDGVVTGLFGISRDMTEIVNAKLTLESSKRQLHLLIKQSPFSMAMLDRELNYLVCSDKWLKSYGRGKSDIIGLNHYQLHPDIPDRWREVHRLALAGVAQKNDDDVWQMADGRTVWLKWVVLPWYTEAHSIGGIIMTSEDVTPEHLLSEERTIASVAFESSDAMLITDEHGVIQKVNSAYTEVTGYSSEEAVGKTQGQLVKSGEQDTRFYQQMWQVLKDNGVWRGELWNRRKNGEVHPVFLSITAIKNSDGEVTHYVGVMQDITVRKQSEQTIQRLAFYDPLTDLPNRRLLLDRLRQSLSASERCKQYGALFFLDLDNFKALNDTLGHHVGDKLLQNAARRLTENVRQSDTVARLGGDEFVVIMEMLGDDGAEAAGAARYCANKISIALGENYLIDGHLRHSTPSLGITLFFGNQVPLEDLLKQADLALYKAKAEGRNTYRFFDPDLQHALEKRQALEVDLHRAIIQGEFMLYYQLQVSRAGKVVGVESLLRWQHSQLGLVGPQDFIPLAEDSSLILDLGQLALKQACEQLRAWSLNPLTAALTIAVNVSAKQFRAEGFVADVRRALEEAGADPRRLKLELTESLLLDQLDVAIEKMQTLCELGIRFSLDDFGTGYSSLAYLKRLPLEQVKIDRSFVSDVLTDDNDAMIARSIIALAHSLGLEVVAEGVESAEVWQHLVDETCDIGQGYWFSKPLPIDDIVPLVQKITRDGLAP